MPSRKDPRPSGSPTIPLTAFERPPESIGPYRILERIGEGDMGIGADGLEVVECLEGYASMLRGTSRDTEAEELEARASSIREEHEQMPDPFGGGP